ncbi:MAG: hypothetical protein V5A68_02860, partial [Candidatus Thermoplasmatota archaeon]
LGWGSGKHYFPAILHNYQWKSNNQTYRFITDYIYDKDIINNCLISKKYDTLLIPGGGVGDGQAIAKGFNFSRKVRAFKKEIRRFMQRGGGVVGICGGAAMITELDRGPNRKPQTFLEKLYNKSSLGLSSVKHFYRDLAFPLFYPFQKNHPEKIGATSYVFSFAPGKTKNEKKIHSGGVPLNFTISKDNPIFKDLKKDKIRIRWWGGPALTSNNNQINKKTKIIARYPKNDFSTERKTSIKTWKYSGGIRGILKAFVKSIKLIKEKNLDLKNVFLYTYLFASPWKKTEKNIKLDFSNRPSIILEEDKNKSLGRIVLCTPHPEYMIWWDGKIEEMKENEKNCLGYGLHRWKDIKTSSKDLTKDLTHTWWIVRRLVAWSAKIPEKDMPPIEKEKKNKNIEKIIEKNVIWNGTLIDQIENI